MAVDIAQGTRFENHGDRQEVEEIAAAGNVPMEVPPNPVGGPVGAPSGGGQLNTPPPDQVLAQMPTDEAPITSGLSMGPGATPGLPSSPEQMMKLTRIQKLVALATMAKSPHIRAQAVSSLKMLVASSSKEN